HPKSYLGDLHLHSRQKCLENADWLIEKDLDLYQKLSSSSSHLLRGLLDKLKLFAAQNIEPWLM
ncbi:hypothetical protein BaRGS_00001842, partial [Batillaria attramentaria]